MQAWEARRGTTAQRLGSGWARVSRAVVRRDGACVDCGHRGSPDNPLTADHVIPRSQGGTNDMSNLVCRCRSCNSSRGGSLTGILTFEQACERVGKSPRTLRLWIADGYLRPVVRLGRAHYYRERDVLEADRLVRRGLPPPSAHDQADPVGRHA